MVDKFEAKKDAMRQVQSGDWKVTFTVQAGDMPDWFMKAEMGKHVVIGIVEVADDGQPVDQEKKEAAKRRYQEASPAQQAVTRAALYAKDPEFQKWIEPLLPHTLGTMPTEMVVAAYIRNYCGVESRAEIAETKSALDAFLKLENEFRDHQRYGDVA